MGCYSGKNITYYQKVNMTYKNVHFAMYFLDGKADEMLENMKKTFYPCLIFVIDPF